VENVETELQTVDKPVIPKLRFEKLEGEYPDLPVIPKINVVNNPIKVHGSQGEFTGSCQTGNSGRFFV